MGEFALKERACDVLITTQAWILSRDGAHLACLENYPTKKEAESSDSASM